VCGIIGTKHVLAVLSKTSHFTPVKSDHFVNLRVKSKSEEQPGLLTRTITARACSDAVRYYASDGPGTCITAHQVISSLSTSRLKHRECMLSLVTESLSPDSPEQVIKTTMVSVAEVGATIRVILRCRLGHPDSPMTERRIQVHPGIRVIMIQ
jgi:hypothetical protein